MGIKRITRFGELILMLDCPVGSSEIIAGVTNNTFDISIATQSFKKLNYTIKSRS
jgi:hypothetical protein